MNKVNNLPEIGGTDAARMGKLAGNNDTTEGKGLAYVGVCSRVCARKTLAKYLEGAPPLAFHQSIGALQHVISRFIAF